jgi:hypothetical protein
MCTAQLFVWDHIRIYVVQKVEFFVGFSHCCEVGSSHFNLQCDFS